MPRYCPEIHHLVAGIGDELPRRLILVATDPKSTGLRCHGGKVSHVSNIQPYSSSASLSLRASRGLARLSDQTTLGRAIVEARAEVQAAKVDAIGAVAGRAMQDVALISQMEQSLAQMVPHASGRLATIADLAAIQMADVVASTARRLDVR
jgi:hypothetical protein